MASRAREITYVRRWTTWAVGVLAVLAGLSDGASARPPKALPLGEHDPHAVTETFLAQHPEAALSISHLAILWLEAAGTHEGDTGDEEGVDRVPYVFERPFRIRLKLHTSADQVQRMVLKDRTGRVVACVERSATTMTASGHKPPAECASHSPHHAGTTGVPVHPGPYALEVHHARKGQADAPAQRIFVRPRFETAGAPRGASKAPPANAEDVVTLEAIGDCENCNFTRADLTGQDFSGLNLSGSKFIGAILTDAKFQRATMVGCDLSSQSLPSRTIVLSTDFTGANLTRAKLNGVGGTYAIFEGATIDDTEWGPIVSDIDGTLLPAELNCANFRTVTSSPTGPFLFTLFSGTDLSDDGCGVRCDFRGASLQGASFEVIFPGTTVYGEPLTTKLMGCDFGPDPSTGRQTVLANIGFRGVNLAGATLDDAMVQGTVFDKADLTGVDLSSAVVRSSTFNDADLAHAKLTSTLLDGVDLFGTALTGVDFTVINPQSVIHGDFAGDLTGTNLSTFNFSGFDLSRADFAHAILSAQSLESLGAATLTDGVAHGINLAGQMFPTGFSQFQGKDLSFAHLAAVTLVDADLAHTTLVQVNLTGATLTGAILSGANLASATLQGADLAFANLDGANLLGAHLNKSPTSLVAASLERAFLRNVNLASANLSGASLIDANFYSTTCAGSGACLCPPDGWSATSPTCASAVGSTMTGTIFSGTYLSGVDMSGATPQAAQFDRAVLIGVNFTGAHLSEDPNGNRTLFTGAFLQGADFTDADVTDADFTSAYVDVTSAEGATMAFLLDATHTGFTGYWRTPKTPACVQVTYNGPTTLPSTLSGNLCPDGSAGQGSNGECTSTQWQSPQTPISQAQPPSSFCQPGTCQCTVEGVSVQSDPQWIF